MIKKIISLSVFLIFIVGCSNKYKNNIKYETPMEIYKKEKKQKDKEIEKLKRNQTSSNIIYGYGYADKNIINDLYFQKNEAMLFSNKNFKENINKFFDLYNLDNKEVRLLVSKKILNNSERYIYSIKIDYNQRLYIFKKIKRKEIENIIKQEFIKYENGEK